MLRNRPILPTVALAVALFPLIVFAADLSQRATFLDAEEALRAGDRALFRRQLEKLEGYPLYPYLLRADLLRRLSAAAEPEISAFLDTYDGQPPTFILRRAWLENRALARDWDVYSRYYRADLGARFDCWEAEAIYRSGAREQGLERAEQLWDFGSSRPKACDAVFAILVDSAAISADLAWRRIGRAMKLGEVQLARYLRRFVPQADRPIVDTWIDTYENPGKALDAGRILPQWPMAEQIVIQSLRRWARYDSPAAAIALDELRTRFHLSGPELADLEHYIALSLAQRGDKQALSRLNSIPAAMQSKDIWEWRARVYMRETDWSGLAAAILDMPPELQQTLLWRYWLARSLDERGEADAAESLFRELAQERDYHGFLAADRLGQPYQLRDRTLPVDETTLTAVASDGAVRRAAEFVSLGRMAPARLEWQYALMNVTEDELRAAARLASSWGWHSEAIATVARARDWDDLDLRFPLVHRRAVANAAKSEAMEPEWIYAIARQESMFREDAKSVAGALGLMQLLPTTAKRVAAGIDLTLKTHSRLLEPAVNIRLGSRYLRLNRDKFKGNALLATAAYNAGPHRVEKWLPKDRRVAADIWVETIPFTETRRYVRRVMEYSVVYATKLDVASDFFSRQSIPIAPAGEPPGNPPTLSR